MRKVVRKRFSIKKSLKIFIPFLIILIILINLGNIINLYRSKVTGYTFKTIQVFNDLDLYDDIKDHAYSETLENIVSTEYYNQKYLKTYLDIDYYDRKNFNSNINSLMALGYNADDINSIYKVLDEDNIQIILENKYLKNISEVLKLSYFNKDYLKRYLVYNTKKDLTYENLITYVNIGLDNDYYTNVNNITDGDNVLVLVNKYNGLSSNYVPSDLVSISSKYNKGTNNKLRKVAKEAFEVMCEAALKDNIKIYSGSAYRSYSYQQNLYNRYVNQDGKTKADTYAARAGYSEHQTGLALDIMKSNWEYISKSDKEYEWLVNNSYKYGFILRYPEKKDDITGYMYEEWHFRYLGETIAKQVYDAGITYDEYVARQDKSS